MTVDSEAIFALAAHSRSDARALEELHGSMAAAWLDEREPGCALRRPRHRPAALARPRPRRRLLRLDEAARSSSSSATCASELRKRELREGTLARAARRARSSRRDRFAPRPQFVEDDPLPAVRAPHERDFCLTRLAAIAAAASRPQRAVGARRRALLDEPLADEELERRPRAPARVEHAVDLPLGEERGVRSRRASAQSANFGSRPSRRASATPCSTARSSRSSPTGDVEAGLAQRVRERAERVPVERLRRHRPRRASRSRAVGGRPSSSPSCASSADELLARREAARDEPGARACAAFQLPKCSITVCGWTVVCGSAANSLIVGERPSRPALAAARRGSARRCSACGCRPGTPRARRDRSPRSARRRASGACQEG